MALWHTRKQVRSYILAGIESNKRKRPNWAAFARLNIELDAKRDEKEEYEQEFRAAHPLSAPTSEPKKATCTQIRTVLSFFGVDAPPPLSWKKARLCELLDTLTRLAQRVEFVEGHTPKVPERRLSTSAILANLVANSTPLLIELAEIVCEYVYVHPARCSFTFQTVGFVVDGLDDVFNRILRDRAYLCRNFNDPPAEHELRPLADRKYRAVLRESFRLFLTHLMTVHVHHASLLDAPVRSWCYDIGLPWASSCVTRIIGNFLTPRFLTGVNQSTTFHNSTERALWGKGGYIPKRRRKRLYHYLDWDTSEYSYGSTVSEPSDTSEYSCGSAVSDIEISDDGYN